MTDRRKPFLAPACPGKPLLACLLSLLAAVGSAKAGAGIQYIEPNNDTGTSRVVIVDDTAQAHTAQLLPLDRDGRLVGKGDAAAQAEKILDNLEAALGAVHSGLDRAVKINIYATGPEVVAEVQKVFARRFRGEAKPAVSFVTGKLAHPEALVAMDAVAVAPDSGHEVKRVRSAALPGAKGGSHVAVLPPGARVYISGQAEKGDLAAATRKTLESLRATLKFLGLNDSDIVQLKAFMHPMSAAGTVEEEMARHFGGQAVPPLVLVEWSSTLPIEIELIASTPRSKDKYADVIEYLTPPGMQASPLFSRVARINRGKTIYVSGLYAGRAASAEEQIAEVFTELGRLLDKAGSDFRHLAKATYYVTDDAASRKLNELRPRYYDPRRPPAASKAMVAGTGQPGKTITLDMIAVPSPLRAEGKPE
ncbi:MAG TPA: RidA family protein [Gemmataceae bacterium]|nr:RidA family protein [Gemmataceae bacterium]